LSPVWPFGSSTDYEAPTIHSIAVSGALRT
jgi:hypothetical protein